MKVTMTHPLAAILLIAGAARGQQTPAPEPTLSRAIEEVKQADGTVKYRALVLDGQSETRGLQPQPVATFGESVHPQLYWTQGRPNLWTYHGNPPGDGIGADLIAADDSLRGPLNLPADRGLVVTNLVPNGPAAAVGLQPNDILLTLFDKPLGKPEDFLAALSAAQAGTPAPHAASLTLLRGGKPTTLPVRALSKVVLAAPPPQPTPDYFIGVSTGPVDETLRSHLTLPAGTGVVVLQVVPDSPAAKAGVAAGDIFLSYEGKPLTSPETLRGLIQAEGAKKATLAVFRKGAETKLAVTPERRKPEPTANVGLEPKALDHQELIVLELQKALEQVNLLEAARVQPGGRNLNLIVDEAQPNLSKKIDDLAAQVQALTKAVDELRKEKK